MKLTIDTNVDSASDMKDVINLLQNVLRNRGHGVSSQNNYSNESNNYSNSSEGRLARKIAKAKAKASSAPVAAPMSMFGEPAEETKSEPATFNMFDSPSESTSEFKPLNEIPEESSEPEPKIEIIPF